MSVKSFANLQFNIFNTYFFMVSLKCKILKSLKVYICEYFILCIHIYTVQYIKSDVNIYTYICALSQNGSRAKTT